ncbi:MAG: LysE family transporter [Geminicoccaceae bacterium]
MLPLATLFGQGLLLGLSIAAPVGPMALLCMRASLAAGFPAGVASGLGVATGDAFYAALAAFGVGAVARLLAGIELWLGLGGGAFLIWFGLRTMLRPPIDPDAAAAQRGGVAHFGTTLGLTLANPPTIMFFAAMFAGLGVAGSSAGTAGAVAVVAGVFCGSMAWWLAFAGAVTWARGRLAGPVMLWVNRVSGVVLAGFGVWAIGRVLWPA